jgi:hypothetical protein
MKPLYCFPILTERSLYWRLNLCLVELIWSTSRCFSLESEFFALFQEAFPCTEMTVYTVFEVVLSYDIGLSSAIQLFQKHCVRSMVSVPLQGLQYQDPPLPQLHLWHRQAQPGGGVPAWICSVAAYRFSCLDGWCLLLNVAPSSSFWIHSVLEKLYNVFLDIGVLRPG